MSLEIIGENDLVLRNGMSGYEAEAIRELWLADHSFREGAIPTRDAERLLVTLRRITNRAMQQAAV